MNINIGDTWKDITAAWINIGDTWKEITAAWINIGDTWKEISGIGWNPPEDGLIAWFQLDKASDLYSNGRRYDRLYGTDYVGPYSGPTGFDTDKNGISSGATIYVNTQMVGYPTGFQYIITGSTSRTVSFWLKGYGLQNDDSLFVYGNTSATQYFWIQYLTASGLVFRDYQSVLSTSYHPTSADTWYWCCITYDGSNVKFYVNNTQQGSNLTKTLNTSIGSGEIKIGGDTVSGNGPTCSMYGYLIYNRVLTSDERLDIYTNQ